MRDRRKTARACQPARFMPHLNTSILLARLWVPGGQRHDLYTAPPSRKCPRRKRVLATSKRGGGATAGATLITNDSTFGLHSRQDRGRGARSARAKRARCAERAAARSRQGSAGHVRCSDEVSMKIGFDEAFETSAESARILCRPQALTARAEARARLRRPAALDAPCGLVWRQRPTQGQMPRWSKDEQRPRVGRAARAERAAG